MRIFSNPFEAMREVERDLFEMGIEVQTKSMQDKIVIDNPDYVTKEIQGYSFKIVNWNWDNKHVDKILKYFFAEEAVEVFRYIHTEICERTFGKASNPGNSHKYRIELWKEFLHNGKFAYTYSERISPQLQIILEELRSNPGTRQAIINIHSNICPKIDGTVFDTGEDTNYVISSADLYNRGGGGRVPCSMYYQIMVREEKVDLIYTMRSCDFLTHFPVDITLALLLQNWFANKLKLKVGMFTYFTGSLHAYQKDMVKRGIF